MAGTLIVALDYDTRWEAEQLIESLGDAVDFYKIGYQLFYGGDGLAHDADGLPHLLHAHHVSIVGVAVFARGDFEFVFFVARVGLLLAQIPPHAAPAQHRTGQVIIPYA